MFSVQSTVCAVRKKPYSNGITQKIREIQAGGKSAKTSLFTSRYVDLYKILTITVVCVFQKELAGPGFALTALLSRSKMIFYVYNK